VLEIVMNQVRGPGNPERHSPLLQFGVQGQQRLHPGVVDVGDRVRIDDDRPRRARCCLDQVPDPELRTSR
jgi:hypothetical protein